MQRSCGSAKERKKTPQNINAVELQYNRLSTTTHVFLGGMRSELSGEYVQYILVYPPALGERRERKIIRINFSQTYKCKRNNTNRNILIRTTNPTTTTLFSTTFGLARSFISMRNQPLICYFLILSPSVSRLNVLFLILKREHHSHWYIVVCVFFSKFFLPFSM